MTSKSPFTMVTAKFRMGLFFLGIFFSGHLIASDLGGYAGAAFRMTSDAISAGMGGITLFQEASSNSYLHNPASLNVSTKKRFNAAMVQLSLDRFLYSVNASFPMPPTAQLSVGLISAGTDNIEARDSRGFYAGDMQDTEMAYMISFSNRFSSGISLGISLKQLNRYLTADEGWLDLNSEGFGITVGLEAQFFPGSRFSAVIKDWNSGYTWKTQDFFERGSSYLDAFPMSFSWGWYQEVGAFALAVEHDYYFIGEHIPRVGVQWNGIETLFLRGGFSYEDETFHPGFSASYHFSMNEKIFMHLDLGMILGVEGEDLRQYLSWGLDF